MVVSPIAEAKQSKKPKMLEDSGHFIGAKKQTSIQVQRQANVQKGMKITDKKGGTRDSTKECTFCSPTRLITTH